MESPALVALPFIGLAGGFLSGLLGLGGGVIMLPLLTFLGGVPLRLATGTSLVHVLIAAATGVLPYSRRGLVDLRAGLVIGFAGACGGMIGSFLSVLLSNQVLELIYLSLIALAVGLLFIPLPLDSRTYKEGNFDTIAGIGIGLGVGFLTGILGIGGGFILIPLMVYILKVPLRVAIGTSLLIILVSSFGTIWAKFNVGHIHLLTTSLVLLGSIAGALLGAHANRRVRVQFLRWTLLSVLVWIFVVVGYKIFG